MRRLATAALLAALAPGYASAQQAGTEGILSWRGADTMLASEIGAFEVVTPAGETLGDVSDTILSRDGRIVALIVGVGGFLGLAEKPVAIAYEHFTVRTLDEGTLEFVCDLDRATLDAAPEYRASER